MFIAGDAAHIHSPFGGQGMNTGLHDAWNLVWKLDLVVRGHADQRLLQTYTEERLPVIKQVIETTHFLTKAMGTPNRLAQVLRNAVIPMVSRLAPFQHAFVQRLSELGVAYRGSPIVEGAGERYFDDSLRGGAGIRSRFLLMLHEDADLCSKEAARQISESLGDIVELRLHNTHHTTLVRPDGYVAFSAPNSNGTAALESARSLLERQTTLSPQ
jgi:4,5-epoxidase